MSETQLMMEEALEKYTKDTFANNNKCENEGELGNKIKSLEVTMENMSESLIQNEKDLKNLLGEKKNNLESKMLDKIRDIEFYDIRLEDYLKNKRMLFKVGIIYIYIIRKMKPMRENSWILIKLVTYQYIYYIISSF